MRFFLFLFNMYVLSTWKKGNGIRLKNVAKRGKVKLLFFTFLRISFLPLLKFH